jgi:hypothetical protein
MNILKNSLKKMPRARKTKANRHQRKGVDGINDKYLLQKMTMLRTLKN